MLNGPLSTDPVHQVGETATSHDQPGWPSGRAMIESAGPAKVVAAVATGSSPVPVGVLDMLEWKWRSIAAQHRNDASERTEDDNHVRLQVAAETLEACALELRLLTDDVTGRQPESNNFDQPTPAK